MVARMGRLARSVLTQGAPFEKDPSRCSPRISSISPARAWGDWFPKAAALIPSLWFTPDFIQRDRLCIVELVVDGLVLGEGLVSGGLDANIMGTGYFPSGPPPGEMRCMGADPRRRSPGRRKYGIGAHGRRDGEPTSRLHPLDVRKGPITRRLSPRLCPLAPGRYPGGIQDMSRLVESPAPEI